MCTKDIRRILTLNDNSVRRFSLYDISIKCVGQVGVIGVKMIVEVSSTDTNNGSLLLN